MSKMKEIADKIATDYDLSKGTAKCILKDIVKAMSDTIVTEKRLQVSGLGSFTVVGVKERQCSLPTVSKVIPATYRVKFKPASVLKDEVRK